MVEAKAKLKILCCTPYFGEQWNSFSSELDPTRYEWTFFNDQPKNSLEKRIRRPNLAMIRAALETVQTAKQQKSNLLITHDPRVTFWCGLFSRLMGVSIKQLALSFNFPELPRGIKRQLMSWAFQPVSYFGVYSSFEKKLYSQHFELPLEHFEASLWSVAQPMVEPQEPLQTGDYICAIGGNSRDYPTLIRAMKQLPEIPLVLVVRPHNLANLELPSNVKTFTNIPFSHAMNLLKHSRFTVIPLKNTEVPCGHVTLVAAMHLGKTFIITNSQGVSDYVRPGQNAITCKALDPDEMAAAILELWNNPAKCETLSKQALQFAQDYCSETAAIQRLQQLLERYEYLAKASITKVG